MILQPTFHREQDRAKVLLVLVTEERHQNESNMDVPEAHVRAPKTVADKIGEIKTVIHFVRLLVNVVNNSTPCADEEVLGEVESVVTPEDYDHINRILTQ